MGIRLDNLDPTASPQRDHVVPAMRDGLAVRLTLAQILGLIQLGDLPEIGGGDIVFDPAGNPLEATDVQAAIAELAGRVALDPTAVGEALIAAADYPALLALLGSGTPGATNFLRGDGVWTAISQDVIVLEDVKTAGTAGGSFTAGAWQTRTLNTETRDTGNHCTLSSNQFTLAAGTYEIDAVCPANSCGLHQARLYNVTGASETIAGTSAQSDPSVSVTTYSHIRGTFAVVSPTAFRIEHHCQSTRATDGFGPTAGFAGNSIFTRVFLRKLA